MPPATVDAAKHGGDTAHADILDLELHLPMYLGSSCVEHLLHALYLKPKEATQRDLVLWAALQTEFVHDCWGGGGNHTADLLVVRLFGVGAW